MTEGVFIAGACQGPKDIPDSVAQGAAAAARVQGMITKGTVMIEPVVASINEDNCSGCRICNNLCPFNAIDFLTRREGQQGEPGAVQGLRHVRRRLPGRGHHRGPLRQRPGRGRDRGDCSGTWPRPKRQRNRPSGTDMSGTHEIADSGSGGAVARPGSGRGGFGSRRKELAPLCILGSGT